MPVMSSVPVIVVPSRNLPVLLSAWITPVPEVPSVPPLMVMLLCSTTLLAFCALIWPPLLSTLVVMASVPPLRASSTPWLTKLPALAGVAMASVPPATSAEMRPLLVRTLLPAA